MRIRSPSSLKWPRVRALWQRGLLRHRTCRRQSRTVSEQSTAANTVVAYEPVWAIGTGLTPTTSDVEEVHVAIRRELAAIFGEDGERMRILYGGSVKPDNAAALMAVSEVNGALVGGASLKASDFLAIVRAYESR